MASMRRAKGLKNRRRVEHLLDRKIAKSYLRVTLALLLCEC